MADHGTGDDLWDEFLRETGKNKAVREPSAAERAKAASRRRRWPVFGAVLCLLTAVAGVAAVLLWPAKTAEPAAAPPALPSPSVSAVPPSAFPARIQGYTRVSSTTVTDCTAGEAVTPPLARLITQSRGCLGVDLALYKDADGNEYKLTLFTLFTLKDPTDAPGLVAALSAHPEIDETAVRLPPQNSGLRALPAGSGLVQDFASYDHAVLIGLAQWSDGHASDLQQLEDRLTPLSRAVADGLRR